jgi:CRP/FNR family transcriptional regulator, cyclic AMP receptor protein
VDKQDTAQARSRFVGRAGKRRLVETLKSQPLVARDEGLARSMSKAGTLVEFSSGDTLMQQGSPENDLFFIVSGAVSVRVNNREVATRLAGSHVGEMALVDSLAKRSATVIATEPTVVLRVEEHAFSRLAAQTPDLWRRVAAEIAQRLRERASTIRQRNDDPVVFIGSSVEGLRVAEEIDRCLRRRGVVRKLWTDGVFQASQTAIESLVAAAGQCDFAVLVLTADDLVVSRRKRKASPRDNVVFELGLFIGALGRDRVVIIKPTNVDIRIPTDLLGVTWLEYARGGNRPIGVRLRAASSAVASRLATLGPR